MNSYLTRLIQRSMPISDEHQFRPITRPSNNIDTETHDPFEQDNETLAADISNKVTRSPEINSHTVHKNTKTIDDPTKLEISQYNRSEPKSKQHQHNNNKREDTIKLSEAMLTPNKPTNVSPQIENVVGREQKLKNIPITDVTQNIDSNPKQVQRDAPYKTNTAQEKYKRPDSKLTAGEKPVSLKENSSQLKARGIQQQTLFKTSHQTATSETINATLLPPRQSNHTNNIKDLLNTLTNELPSRMGNPSDHDGVSTTINQTTLPKPQQGSLRTRQKPDLENHKFASMTPNIKKSSPDAPAETTRPKTLNELHADFINPRLEPHAPRSKPPAATKREEPRLVIGSLRVEVVPSSPVSVERGKPASNNGSKTPKRTTTYYSSSLRFGLGQM